MEISLLPDPQSYPVDKEDGKAWDEYIAAVSRHMDGLVGMSVQAKRRNVVWYLAWQSVTPNVSEASIFRREDCCSKTIYQNKWKGQKKFMAILNAVKELTRRYVDGKDARKLAYRRDRVREMEWGAAETLSDKVVKMMAFPLTRAVAGKDEITENEDGSVTIIRKTIIEPADWRLADTARMAKAMSDLGRRSTGMDNLETVVEEDVPDIVAFPFASLSPEALNRVIENLILQMESGEVAEEGVIQFAEKLSESMELA